MRNIFKLLSSEQGFCFLRETSFSRAVSLRFNRAGVYLLVWQGEQLVAGLTFQYPEFITGNEHYLPGFTSFNWDYDWLAERIDYLDASHYVDSDFEIN